MVLSAADGSQKPAPEIKGAGSMAAPVISTKELSAELIQEAANAGIRIENKAFIQTRPVIDTALKARLTALADQRIYAAFTSGIAAKAVADQLEQPPAWDLFSIQGQTRETVAACFPASRILATASYGADLANEIIRNGAVKELYFFCGNRRMDSLSSMLPQAGISVREFVVYQTALTPVQIEGPISALLFFSPSGVESYCSLNRIPPELPLFSIGNTTTAAIQKKCSNRIYTATRASTAGVVELLIEKIKH